MLMTLLYFFTLSGSTSVKAACKTLVKLTPDRNKVGRGQSRRRNGFASFFHVLPGVFNEKLERQNARVKFKMLHHLKGLKLSCNGCS